MVVLGASGFLGRAIVARLTSVAGTVVAVSRGTATPTIVELHGSDIMIGDVTERIDMERALEGADVAFVMAGVSGAAQSWAEQRRSLDTNVGGLTNVLEVITSRGASTRVVFPSSRLVYGRATTLPIREDAPLQPASPYALHKITCEQLLKLSGEHYGLSYAIARLTNPYGARRYLPNQSYNIVSTMIAHALANQEIVVFGDGTQLRDYIYIEDAVDSLAALGTLQASDTVNVGSGVPTRFVDVANMIVRLAGRGRLVRREWPPEYASVESGDFVADVTRARELIGLAARGIDEGLRQSLAR